MATAPPRFGSAIILAVVALVLLVKCSEPSDDEIYVADELGVSTDEAAALIDQYASADDAIDEYRVEIRPEFDEDAARAQAEQDAANESYDYSYGCTQDCSGHEAGWQWRAETGYPVEDATTYGNSNSFAEGAMAYDESVEERVEEMRSEHESGIDPY